MAVTPDELVAPPQEVPGVYTDAVAKLHKTARNLMVLKGIPWFIQATLSDEGFVSMEDLATRWDSPDRARETAPGFAPNNHHYTDVTSRLIAARMFQVVHAAQRSMGVGAHATAGPGPHTPGDTAPNLTVSCERGQLERVWEEKTKLTKPKLALQGSDQLVKRQFKLCAGGEIAHSRSQENGHGRPLRRARLMAGTGRMRWKSGASPKLATSSRGCTRCSATPSSCASSRSRSSASSTSPGRTWRAGTSGSMVRTSGAAFPRQRTTSWQLPNATHGGRFTRRSRPFPGAAHQPGLRTTSEGQEQVQGQGEVQGQAWEQREG